MQIIYIYATCHHIYKLYTNYICVCVQCNDAWFIYSIYVSIELFHEFSLGPDLVRRNFSSLALEGTLGFSAAASIIACNLCMTSAENPWPLR